jgi:hypothetical protein
MVAREAKKYFLPADQQSFSDRWSPKALPIDFLIGKSVWLRPEKNRLNCRQNDKALKHNWFTKNGSSTKWRAASMPLALT